MTEEFTEIKNPPPASNLLEGLRNYGYSLSTAMADIIDNSIAAGASNISIRTDPYAAMPSIAVIDDGHGMNSLELFHAMQIACMNPQDERSESDLGRFGLGLKTASFSQCRRLTVLSKRKGEDLYGLAWDLDFVRERNDFIQQRITEPALHPLSSEIREEGTVVIWEKIDRMELGSDDSNESHDHFNSALAECRDHLELVFHRFLDAIGGNRVSIDMNDDPLVPLDPFMEKHQATMPSTEQNIPIPRSGGGTSSIRCTTFTIPHFKKLRGTEWDKAGMRDGHFKNQGFYIYRRNRLIMHGGWFGLMRLQELTKLARVRVDLPADLDFEWKIDVKKSSAQLPSAVKASLRLFLKAMSQPSERVFRYRGQVKTLKKESSYWNRVQIEGKTIYEVNLENDQVSALISELPTASGSMVRKLLRVLGATLPLDGLYSDIASEAGNVTPAQVDLDDLQIPFEMTMRRMHENMSDASDETKLEVMLQFEPFKSNPEPTRVLFEQHVMRSSESSNAQ